MQEKNIELQIEELIAEADKNDFNAIIKLADKYTEIKKWEDAAFWYKKAICINSLFVDAYNGLGNAYGYLRRYNDAIECYNKVLKLDPDNAIAYSGLAFNYLGIREYKLALDLANKSISLRPDYAPFYNTLGFIYNNLAYYFCNKDFYIRAIEAFDKCIKLDPNYSLAYSSLGVTYNNLENYALTIKYCFKAIELDPLNVSSYNNIGYAYIQFEKYDMALKFLLKAIEIDPNFAAAYKNIGIIYYRSRNFDLAISYFEKTLEINPNFAAAYKNIAKAYRELGKYDESIVYFKKAIELDSIESCVIYSEYYYNDLISFEEAEDTLLKAINLNDECEAQLELGKLYLVPEYKNEELAYKHLLKAKELGYDCEYEIKQIENQYDNEFIDGIKEFTKINSPSDMNAIRDFARKYVGEEFNLLNDYSQKMILKCIGTYAYESITDFGIDDYSNTLINLAKAIEKELDIRLGVELLKFIKRNNLEGDVADKILKRKKARNLGEYSFEFKKETYLLNETHLDFLLNQVFKPNVFGEINKETNVTNYISYLVKEINKFSEYRNNAAHIKPISKETAEAWLDKMLGSGNMLQNFLAKLRTN